MAHICAFPGKGPLISTYLFFVMFSEITGCISITVQSNPTVQTYYALCLLFPSKIGVFSRFFAIFGDFFVKKSRFYPLFFRGGGEVANLQTVISRSKSRIFRIQRHLSRPLTQDAPAPALVTHMCHRWFSVILVSVLWFLFWPLLCSQWFLSDFGLKRGSPRLLELSRG